MYKQIIDKQIKQNNGANLFLADRELNLKFTKNTLEAISKVGELDVESETLLIKYATEKAMEEFCRINQYYAFSSEAKNELEKIYADLLEKIRSKKHTGAFLEQHHYKNLKNWLKKTNPFAEKLYSEEVQYIEPVVCSEYSAEMQLHVLQLNANAIMEPVLDIGCGKNGNLVSFLCEKGIFIQGIDRIVASTRNLINADWLEYDYGNEKWGTIYSNLGFSNHFNHHNLRDDGNYMEYAQKYMEILKSLKIGGKFHYAPDLPFIELYLDSNKFHIEKHHIERVEFKTTIVTKLRA